MKKITFTYFDDYAYNVHERPSPSSEFIPNWFKDMPPYAPSPDSPEGTKIIVENFMSNATAKKCTPMLDAIVTGYTVHLWSDVQVRYVDGFPSVSWRVKLPVFSEHNNYGAPLIPPPPGYSNMVFKYLPYFQISTPPGYSIMIRPPAGHYDLPFHAVPAIVDSDTPTIDSNFPLWIRSDLDGIIEKGTPIAQIIPFKRDNWKAEFSKKTGEQHLWHEDKTYSSNIINNYTRNIWKKKTFK